MLNNFEPDYPRSDESAGLGSAYEIEISIRNSYKKLTGIWKDFYDMAYRFENKVVRIKIEPVKDGFQRPARYITYRFDKEDLRHDIIIKLYKASLRYNSGDRQMSEKLMEAIARNCVRDYWRRYYSRYRIKMDASDNYYEDNLSLTQARLLSLDIDVDIDESEDDESLTLEDVISNDRKALISEPERVLEEPKLESLPKNFKFTDDRLNVLPEWRIELAKKQHMGYPLNKTERQRIWRYNKEHKVEGGGK